MKISILMPTRKRISNLHRLFISLNETVYSKSKLEISARVDEDDFDSVTALNALSKAYNIDVKINIGKHESVYGAYWNDAWRGASGELYMMLGDDFVFRSPGWDEHIRQIFSCVPDRILFVFGRDGIQEGYIGTHGVIHKNWTDRLGYYAPMQFRAYCHDRWLDDIATKIGRKKYVPELYFEHIHYANNKAEMDDNYSRMKASLNEDNLTWQKTETVRIIDALKLKEILK